MSKKVHVGKNGSPRCVRRLSLHVAHGPSIVVTLEEFLKLDPARRCQKCEKLVSTKQFAGELGRMVFGGL